MYDYINYFLHYRQLVKGERNQRGSKGSTFIDICLDKLDLAKVINEATDSLSRTKGEIDKQGEPVQRHKVRYLIKEWIVLS